MSDPLTVTLTDSGKRFNREWIFRHINYQFETGKSYAVTGPNGSGKSTLLQAISGSLHLSEGELVYKDSDDKLIDNENIYRCISLAAPYLELVEEMTAREFLKFHGSFKPLLANVTIDEIFVIIGLEKSADKQVRYFSSGMKQRLKLAQAVFSNTPVLLLDEPCTNLDKNGYQLYHDLLAKYCMHKLIIISSNDENEIDICTERLNIPDHK
jgi:ABC-2 type transport system ATP-binding protein